MLPFWTIFHAMALIRFCPKASLWLTCAFQSSRQLIRNLDQRTGFALGSNCRTILELSVENRLQLSFQFHDLPFDAAGGPVPVYIQATSVLPPSMRKPSSPKVLWTLSKISLALDLTSA